MSAAPTPTPPSPTELRQFGLVLATALIVVFGGALPWLFGRAFPLWPWWVAAAIAAPAAVYPRALAPLHRAWMVLGHALGWFNTRLILGAVFFLIIVPFGVVLRLLGKPPIPRRPDPDATSYRIDIARNAPPEDLRRPF